MIVSVIFMMAFTLKFKKPRYGFCALPTAFLLFAQITFAREASASLGYRHPAQATQTRPLIIPPGAVDRTFHSSGYFRYNEGSPYSILFAPDGKMYIGGIYGFTGVGGPDSPPSLQIVRLNPDGTLDQTFGQKGVISDTSCESSESMQVDAEGNLIVLSSRNKNYLNCSIRRFSTNGSPDTSFNSKVGQSLLDGRYVFDEHGNIFFIKRLTNTQIVGPEAVTTKANINRISPDGSILSTISVDISSQRYLSEVVPKIAIARAGNFWLTFDNQFQDNSGKHLEHRLAIIDQMGKYNDLGDFSRYGNIRFIQFQSNGILILTDKGILRLDSKYQIDQSFGENGIISGSFQSIEVDHSDRIFAASYSKDNDPRTDITCYSSNGKIDPSFAYAGVFSITGLIGTPNAMRGNLSSPFRLLVAGMQPKPGEGWNPLNSKEWAVYALTADGDYDRTFAEVPGTSVQLNPGQTGGSGAVALTSDGGILQSIPHQKVGEIGSDELIYRIGSDGTIDTKFGKLGSILALDKSFVPVAGGYSGIVPLPDGRFFLVGTLSHPSSTQPAQSEIFAKRFLKNGAIDSSYGHAGFASLFSGGCLPENSSTCQYQLLSSSTASDGSLFLFAAETIIAEPFHYAGSYFVARVNPNGVIDQKFGKVTLPFFFQEPSTYPFLWKGGILTLSDGKVLVYGTRQEKTKELSLVRINPDGALDSSFGVNGVASFDPDQLANDGKSETSLYILDAKETPDRGIVLRIDRNNDDTVCASLIKIDSTGNPGQKFGNGGFVAMNGGWYFITTPGIVHPSPWILAPSDGSILVGNTLEETSYINVYSSDGSPNTAYGNNGQLNLQNPQPGGNPFLTPNGELIFQGSYKSPGLEGTIFAFAKFWL